MKNKPQESHNPIPIIFKAKISLSPYILRLLSISLILFSTYSQFGFYYLLINWNLLQVENNKYQINCY